MVGPSLCLRDELLELVKTVRPTVRVKLTASLGFEGMLSQGDLGRLVEIPKRQLDQVLDVVGIWGLVYERVGEGGGRSTSRTCAGESF